MKRTILYVAIALLTVSAAFTVSASTSGDKEVTVTGEVIDLKCFEGKATNRGESHKACAVSCAKRGNQLALVDADNNIYSITGAYADNKNEKLVEYVAATVVAKGVVTEKEGKKYIAVSSLKLAEKK